MFLEIRGSGPVIVMLHGMPQRPGSCWKLGRHFTGDYTVVVPSLPGYGASPTLRPYDFDAAQSAWVAELTRHGIDAVHAVVGMSGGAYRALRLAVSGVLAPSRLALFGALAGPMGEEHKASFRGFAAALRADVSLRDAVLQMASPDALVEQPTLAQELESWLAAPDAETLAQELEAFATQPRLLPDLAGIEVPVLVMVGQDDEHTPLTESQAIAEALPNAILRVVPGARHALWWEAEAECVQALKRLLAV